MNKDALENLAHCKSDFKVEMVVGSLKDPTTSKLKEAKILLL